MNIGVGKSKPPKAQFSPPPIGVLQITDYSYLKLMDASLLIESTNQCK